MDPCEAAAKASQNCMERTHYNRDEVSEQTTLIGSPADDVVPSQCLDFFQVYKDCKSSWVSPVSLSPRAKTADHRSYSWNREDKTVEQGGGERTRYSSIM